MLILCCLLSPAGYPQPVSDDQQPASLSGTLTIVGSDTMAELMQAWTDRLLQAQPELRVQLHATGSGTAPPALIRGTTSVGAMSRPMNDHEQREFVSTYGYAPTEFTVALDAITIIVNRSNPLESLALTELAAIFSTQSNCYPQQRAARQQGRWEAILAQDNADYPAEHPLRGRSIQRFGRNAASGTYAWFRDNALCGGDYLAAVNALPGNGSVVTAVQQSANGIGYVGVAFASAGVKALALSSRNAEPVTPSLEAIRNGRYPLTRQLYVYANRPPGRRLVPEIRALLGLIYSPAGQSLVTQTGLIPLPEAVIQQNTAVLSNSTPVIN